MPVITIVTNVQGVDITAKRAFIAANTAAFADEIKCPADHVHTHIVDGQCFAFGGDLETPAAHITVKASALQIYPEVRKMLVERMAPLLQQHLGIPTARTTTMFEELPIENIAVGTNIAVFLKSPRTSISPHETGKGTPDRRKGVLA